MKQNNFESSSAVQSSTLHGLSRLLALDEKALNPWRESDAAAMLRHQLNADLDFDLSPPNKLLASDRAKQRDIQNAREAGIKTFKQLFEHTAPPVRVLKIAKDFFKRLVQETPKERPDNSVAHVCYYLSIGVARLTAGERISSLTDSQLLQGLDWSAKCGWVDQDTWVLLARCISALQPSPQQLPGTSP